VTFLRTKICQCNWTIANFANVHELKATFPLGKFLGKNVCKTGKKYLAMLKARVTRWLEKNHPRFGKSAQNNQQAKKGQNVHIKTECESPKHIHQTTFEP
jgi:hypothetical protein